jgi:hypothetical protein
VALAGAPKSKSSSMSLKGFDAVFIFAPDSLLPAYCSDASVTPYFTMQALYQFIF